MGIGYIPNLVVTTSVEDDEPGEDEPGDRPSAVDSIEDAGHVTVYNLQGVKVLDTDNVKAVNTLKKGIYVVIGRKVAVR